MPLAKRYSRVLLATLDEPAAVLDVGAGDRRLGARLAQHFPSCRYASFDVDTTGGHDFTSLEAIDGRFDAVCMFMVIARRP